MRRYLWICTGLVGCFWASLAEAATRTTLAGQIHSLANQVKKVLKEDPRLIDQPLQLGKFDGEGEASATNFGQRIELMLRTELSVVLKDKATHTLAGSYLFVTPDDPTLKNARILLVTVQIKDRGRQIVPISVEVNDTDDIMQVLGLTGAAPSKPDATFQERNTAAQAAQAKPTFDVQEGTRVAAQGLPQWSMGILKKPSSRGSTSRTAPQNVNGFAFVPIAIGEYYEIELVNNDKIDAVASVTIDGLDVANTFSSDQDSSGKPIHWPGYLVHAGGRFVIRGWQHTIDQKAKDNVFSFRIAELGQGAASALKARGGVGVITVQFREACPPNGKLSGRSFGETAKGEGLAEKLTTKPMQIGENVLSTISIRYNRPE